MENPIPLVPVEVDEQEMINQIKELRMWIANQPTIPELSDSVLEIFLHSCIYQVDATKQTLLAYFKLRMESPFYFMERNPFDESIKSLITTGYCCMLPGMTDEGYRVIMCGYLPWNDNCVFKNIVKRFMMQIDLWLSKIPKCAGFYIIIDSQFSCLSHFTFVTFDSVKKLSTYLQEGLPVRLKGLFFINISTGTNTLISMSQPILSKKIWNMIHKHVTGDDGYMEYVPKRMLPKEFGGDQGTIQELNEAALQEMEDNAEWFREQDKIITSLVEKQKLSNA